MKKRLLIVGFGVLGCLMATVSLTWRRSGLTHYRGQALPALSLQAAGGDIESTEALKRMGASAVPELIDLLQTHENPAHRWMVSRANRLPPSWRLAALQRLKQPEPALVRETAAKSLGIIGPPSTPAVPFLVQSLRDRQGAVCWNAATALGRVGEGAVPNLVKALADRDDQVRHAAAYALGEAGPGAERAIPALLQSLLDKNEQVRDSSAYSLSMIGGPAIIALFEAQLHGTQAISNRLAAVIEKWDSTPAGTTERLIEMAKHGPTLKRIQGIEALGKYRPRSGLAMRAMTDLLNDPSPEIRLATVQFMRDAGPRARKATPSIEKLTQDKEDSVRAAARDLLATFQQ